MMDKADILKALTDFAEQPPGMIAEDYDTQAQYDADHRRWCDEPLVEFKAMRAIIESRDDIDGDALAESIRWTRRIRIAPAGGVEYTPGQNGALEYRTAACNVLSNALIEAWSSEDGEDIPPFDKALAYSQGQAEQMLGETIVERYFR